MSEFEFASASRESTSVIIAVAGASGSGKTFTALQLALGLAGDGWIAVIGSEGRRALHYAPAPGDKPDFVNTFPFRHMELHAPYSPRRWLSAFQAAENAGAAVVIADSFSDEHVGEGGLVDMAAAELAKMKKPNSAAAWARPKADHKLVTRWMRTCKAHLIVCLRAEEKVELRQIGGETKVIPIGWQAVCEKTVPFEMMTSIMLHPASRDDPTAPGKPFPIKIQEQHRAFFPADKPITREAGRALAAWAAGAAVPSPSLSQSRAREGASGAVEPERGTNASRLLDAAKAKAQLGTIALDEALNLLSDKQAAFLKTYLPTLRDMATTADVAATAASEPPFEDEDNFPGERTDAGGNRLTVLDAG